MSFSGAHVRKRRLHKNYNTYVGVELRKIMRQIQNHDFGIARFQILSHSNPMSELRLHYVGPLEPSKSERFFLVNPC